MLESSKGKKFREMAGFLGKSGFLLHAEELRDYAKKADNRYAISLGVSVGYILHLLYVLLFG